MNLRLFLEILAAATPILVMGVLAYLIVRGEVQARVLRVSLSKLAIRSGFAQRRDLDEIWAHGREYRWSILCAVLLLFGLIALVLAFQLVQIQAVTPKTGLENKTVEHLLSQLPTADLVTRQHEEMLKALDRPSLAPTSSSFKVGGVWAFLSFGVVGVLLLLASMLRPNNVASKVGAVTGAFMIATSGGLTFFKSTGPLLQIDMKNDFQYKPSGGASGSDHLLLTIDVGAGGTIPDCGDSKKHDQAVYPFNDGDPSLTPAMGAQISAIRNLLGARRGQGKLVGLLLIGSADRRGLVGRSAHRYGSNATLAQARARAVADALDHPKALWPDHPDGLWPDHPKVITHLDTGAQIIGTKDRIVMAPDRSVLICGLWN